MSKFSMRRRQMEIAVNLLRLANEWIVAQVDEVEGDTLLVIPIVYFVNLYGRL